MPPEEDVLPLVFAMTTSGGRKVPGERGGSLPKGEGSLDQVLLAVEDSYRRLTAPLPGE